MARRSSVLRHNRTLLQKADTVLADLTTNGGLLQPTQARKFLRVLIHESILLKMATVVPMSGPKHLIENIRFNRRVLRRATENTALTLAQRSTPNLGKAELNAKEFKAEVRLSDQVLDGNIERGELRQTIMQTLGESISADMEDVGINGDVTLVGDDLLGGLDGLLKQATTNIVDAADTPTRGILFRDMLKTLPAEFLRNRKKMRMFTSIDGELDYRESLTSRDTVVGDKFLETDAPASYSGVPIVPVPLMPENLGVSTDQTVSLFTDPKNINFGVWRQIRVETDKDISAGTLIIVATLSFDVKYGVESAVVKGINIAVE